MKDWNGNKLSTFVTIGASNHTAEEREPNDYYATSPVAIEKLLRVYTPKGDVWEPACGEGHLCKVLRSHGINVFASDLVDRGYGDRIMDFLQEETLPPGIRCILTNPPYKYATEFVLHALELLPDGCEVVMLLKTTFLEGKKRRELLYDRGLLKHVYQFSERVACAKNGDFGAASGSAVSYAWFVFSKGGNAVPSISWL